MGSNHVASQVALPAAVAMASDIAPRRGNVVMEQRMRLGRWVVVGSFVVGGVCGVLLLGSLLELRRLSCGL